MVVMVVVAVHDYTLSLVATGSDDTSNDADKDDEGENADQG